MASSQDKAIALKDAYIKGIVDATSEAPAMPEQDMGDTAGIIMDLETRRNYFRNDGDPTIYVTDGVNRTKRTSQHAKYPIKGKEYGTVKMAPMSNRGAMNAAEILYEGAPLGF